jgi:hypothetical protein
VRFQLVLIGDEAPVPTDAGSRQRRRLLGNPIVILAAADEMQPKLALRPCLYDATPRIEQHVKALLLYFDTSMPNHELDRRRYLKARSCFSALEALP